MNETAAVTGKKFTTQRLAMMAMFAAILCIFINLIYSSCQFAKLSESINDGKREGYFTLQLREGGVAIVQFKNGKSIHNSFNSNSKAI